MRVNLLLCDGVYCRVFVIVVFFFFQAEDGIRDADVTGVQTCALPIWTRSAPAPGSPPPAAKAAPAGWPQLPPPAAEAAPLPAVSCPYSYSLRSALVHQATAPKTGTPPDSVTRSPPPCHTAIRPDAHNLVTRRIPVLPFIITRMRATHPRRLAPTALHVRRLHPDPDGLLDNGLAQLTTLAWLP